MQEENPNPHPYKTLGGWLETIVATGFLSVLVIPIVATVMPIQIFKGKLSLPDGFVQSLREGHHAAVLLGVWILVFGYMAAMLFLPAMQINCRDARFLRTYQLMAVAPLLLYLAVLALSVYTRNAFLALVESFLVLFPALLMLYFIRSVRVRTYMGSDEYLRRAFFTKKIKGPEPAVPDEEES